MWHVNVSIWDAKKLVIHFTYILYHTQINIAIFLAHLVKYLEISLSWTGEGAHYHINVFQALLFHLEDMSATGSGAVCLADLSGFCLTFLKRSKWKGPGQSLNTLSKQSIWDKSLNISCLLIFQVLFCCHSHHSIFLIFLPSCQIWGVLQATGCHVVTRVLNVPSGTPNSVWSPTIKCCCWTKRRYYTQWHRKRLFSYFPLALTVFLKWLQFFLICSSCDLIKWIVLNVGVKMIQLGHWN